MVVRRGHVEQRGKGPDAALPRWRKLRRATSAMEKASGAFFRSYEALKRTKWSGASGVRGDRRMLPSITVRPNYMLF
jgi:hypothetical protein